MGDLYRLPQAQNSGTGAIMQFSGYLSPCYYIPSAARDGDVTWMSRNGFNDLVQPSCFNHYQVYEKEMIRQAMLNHEAIFRYQVHELHRLYKTQNELMAEHRMRELAAHQHQIQRSQTNWLVNSVCPDISQKTAPPWSFVNAKGCVPSLSSQRFLQSPIFPRFGLQSDNKSVLTERTPTDNEGLPPKKKKLRKRIIDLELPAVLYIDSDEEDNSICSKSVADVPPALCSLAKESSEFHLESDQPVTFDTTGSVNNNFGCEGTKLCIDLNETIPLDDESYSCSHLKSVTCSSQTVHRSPVSSRKPVKESKASNGISVMPLEEKQLEHQPLNSEPVSDEIILVQHSSAGGTSLASNISSESHDSPKIFGSFISCSPQHVPHQADSDVKALSSVTSQRRPPSDFREVPLAVQALPCFNTTKVSKGPKSAYSSSRNHTSKLMVKKYSANDADIGGKEPFQVHKRLSKRMKYLRDHKLLEYVDLNCMPPDFESVPTKSNDNEKMGDNTRSTCDAVSVNNDEANLATSKEDLLNVGERDKIAAEAIILMSSSRGAMTPEPSGPLVNCLNWFAGITSYVSEDLCDEIKEICYKAADCDDLLGSFRATNLETRKVRIKRINDASCIGKKQNEKHATEECLPRLQGNGRRPKKPRILKEKSLHAIGMERTTDTAFDNIKRRKRNTCNTSAKRRTRIEITHCDDLERSMCSSPISNTKGKTEGKCLPRWGSGAGRRKARKARRVFDVFPLYLSEN